MTAPGLATCLAITLVFTTGCTEQPAPSQVDQQALRDNVQQLTEDLYWSHLRLDTARAALEEADAALAGQEGSAAAYHVAEAYRVIEMADEKLLDLGQQTQQAFDLDRNQPP